jgi:hypothetical protein
MSGDRTRTAIFYQSATDDVSGTYKAEITATSGAYVGFSRIFFTLKGEVT